MRKRGNVMKKSTILLPFLLLVLTACGADPKPVETVRVVEEEEIRKGMYQEVEYLERMPEVTQIVPFRPENAISGCFCANGDTVFYLAYFGDYLLDQETGNNKEFEPQYNTQIWAYDKESGSCAPVYQYDEDWCVEISGMVCNESTLIWVDYDEGWRLQAMSVDGSASAEIIASKADMDSELWTVTPVIDGNRVFWHDRKEGEEGFSAYEYDLASGRLTKLGEEAQTTPYGHMSVMNQMFASCEKEEDLYRLRFQNMDTGDSLLLETTVPVLSPISNGRVCAWRTSYDSYDARLYVYDHKAGTVEWIELPKDELGKEGYFFSYAVLDRMVIVNYRGSSLSRVGRLLCYDIETKTYTELASVDKNGTFMYTFQDSESRVSLEMSLEQDDFRVLEIFYDSEQNQGRRLRDTRSCIPGLFAHISPEGDIIASDNQYTELLFRAGWYSPAR